MDVIEQLSANAGARRGGVQPDMVVLHYTGMTSAKAALERLCDPAAEVSAHYLIAEDGCIWRLVPEILRAWHAGNGTWGGSGDINSRSIGVELANPGPLEDFPPFPEPQLVALEGLLDGIMGRWSVPPARVIGHSDMAPGRKADPGPKFDWRRLARGGRAVWTAAQATGCASWPDFCEAAECFGYGLSRRDRVAVLDAFRLHFRPEARGMALDGHDMALIRALSAAHPWIDRAGLRE